MDNWALLFSDPVVLMSLGGLAIVLLICLYYVGLFLYKANHND